MWSLGIVLLNLLFHRCPWADPTLDDPDYSAFSRDRAKFLETRFQGIGNEIATFLATRIFTDMEEQPGTRVTAGEFGRWASKLVRYMGEGSRRASISDATVQLVASVRQSPRLVDAKSLYNSPRARSPRHSVQLSGEDVEASPSRKPLKNSSLPNDLVEELASVGLQARQQGGQESLARVLADQMERLEKKVQHLQVDNTAGEGDTPQGAADQQDAIEDGETGETPEEKEEKERKERHKRRKRGARKAKAATQAVDGITAAGEEEPDNTSPAVDALGSGTTSPEIHLVETSQHIQAFAREISKTTKPPPISTSHSFSPDSAAQKDKDKLARPSKSRFSDRFKGAFANGNQDLQAFQQRARERDVALTGGGASNPTASAPAKMQHGAFNATGSAGVSSFGSVGSAGSWSEDGGGATTHWASTGSRRERLDKLKKEQHAQGRGVSVDRTSTSVASPIGAGAIAAGAGLSRPGRGQRSSVSSSSIAGSSPSRQSYTPTSSFSSTTSFDGRSPITSPATGGGAIGGLRSPLQVIDERTKDVSEHRDSPPATASTLRPDTFAASAQIIREPLPPPMEPAQSVSASSTPATPQPPKAKFGRLFKFSRS